MKEYMHLNFWWIVLKLPPTHCPYRLYHICLPTKDVGECLIPHTCHMCVFYIVVCLCKIHEISDNFILVKIATHFSFNTLLWLKLNIFMFKCSLFLFLSTVCVICCYLAKLSIVLIFFLFRMNYGNSLYTRKLIH